MQIMNSPLERTSLSLLSFIREKSRTIGHGLTGVIQKIIQFVQNFFFRSKAPSKTEPTVSSISRSCISPSTLSIQERSIETIPTRSPRCLSSFDFSPLIKALTKDEVEQALQIKLQANEMNFATMFILTYKLVMSTDELFSVVYEQLISQPPEDIEKLLSFLQNWIDSELYINDLRLAHTKAHLDRILEWAKTQPNSRLERMSQMLENKVNQLLLHSNCDEFISSNPIELEATIQTLYQDFKKNDRNQLDNGIRAFIQQSSQFIHDLYSRSSISDLIIYGKRKPHTAAQSLMNEQDRIINLLIEWVQASKAEESTNQLVEFLFYLNDQFIEAGVYFLVPAIHFALQEGQLISHFDFQAALFRYQAGLEIAHHWAYAIVNSPAGDSAQQVDASLSSLQILINKIQEHNQAAEKNFHFYSKTVRELQTHLLAFDRLVEGGLISLSLPQQNRLKTLHEQADSLRLDEFRDARGVNTYQAFKKAFEKINLSKVPIQSFFSFNVLMARVGEEFHLIEEKGRGCKQINLRGLAGYAKYLQNYDAIVQYSRRCLKTSLTRI